MAATHGLTEAPGSRDASAALLERAVDAAIAGEPLLPDGTTIVSEAFALGALAHMRGPDPVAIAHADGTHHLVWGSRSRALVAHRPLPPQPSRLLLGLWVVAGVAWVVDRRRRRR